MAVNHLIHIRMCHRGTAQCRCCRATSDICSGISLPRYITPRVTQTTVPGTTSTMAFPCFQSHTQDTTVLGCASSTKQCIPCTGLASLTHSVFHPVVLCRARRVGTQHTPSLIKQAHPLLIGQGLTASMQPVTMESTSSPSPTGHPSI